MPKDNHVHLLATPPAAGAIVRFMQKFGRGYVAQFNVRHRHSGTLWDRRYKAGLVDRGSYVLHCHRYIDFNPVRARMDDPVAYLWLSCASHCGQHPDTILTPHPAFIALAFGFQASADACRCVLREILSDDGMTAIRKPLQQQRAVGRDDFPALVEAKTQSFAGVRPAHRPPRSKSNGCK